MRDAATVLGIIRERELAEGKLLESRMSRKHHVRFGGGPLEKDRTDRYLASGLPYIKQR